MRKHKYYYTEFGVIYLSSDVLDDFNNTEGVDLEHVDKYIL